MGDLTAPVLLALTLAALVWVQRNDVKNFAAFAAIDDTRVRQRRFLIAAAKSCAFYLGVPLVGLALLGRLETVWPWYIPSEFWALAGPMPLIRPSDVAPTLIGLPIGLALGGLIIFIRGRRPVQAPKPRKIAAMVPRNGAEALALLPLILNAGISEEVFSRLYIPLLMVLCGVDAGIAFVATTLIFGALHRYQGWLGMIVTTVLGGVLALAYLAGDGLWLPVALHLGINLTSLLLGPAIRQLIRRPAA